jgi:MSHA biogenesis protein MshO
MTVVSTFQRGFTLIESIVVIVISGIMLAAVAMFLRWPFQSYIDTERRGQLADTVDTALRRAGRDLRNGLPNSIRILPGTPTCIELLLTRTGGRYRTEVDSNTGKGDILDFTTADTSFDMFGQFSTIASQIPVTGAGNDQLVVYNLGSSSPGADAYAGNNTIGIASTAPGAIANETNIVFTGPKLFPLASPGNRFQIISGPVSYVCNGAGTDALGNGTGTLRRVVSYPIVPVQSCPPAAGVSTLLANNVSACQFTYIQTSSTERNGLVQMQLQITQANETVSLDYETHVSNVP